MPIPIVFVHKGNSWYLWYTLRQAKLTNPQSEIYLISNTYHPQYRPFARHFHLDDYFAEASQLPKIYRHLSTNSVEFELFALQRWFVLRSFSQKQGLKQFFTQDSDVMVYTDLSEEQKRLATFGMSVTKEKGPQSVFINDIKLLDGFCEFVTMSYATRSAELKDRYQKYWADCAFGGIGEMVLLQDYIATCPEQVVDTFTISDGAVYDNNVNVSEGFEVANGIKHFVWKQGQPFGRHLETGKLVRFNTIHFQGGAKMLIPYFASSKNWDLYRQFLFQTPPRTAARSIVRKIWR